MKLLTSPYKKDNSPQPSQEQNSSLGRVLVTLGVLAVGAGLSLTYFLPHPQNEDMLFSSTKTFPLRGEVKGDETNVVAIVPGQVEWAAVSEGDSVEQGQVLAQLSSSELQTQLEDIQRQLATAEQRKQQVEAEREVLREKLWNAYLKLRPDERELDEWVRDADQDIIVTKTQLAAARAKLQQTRNELGYTNEQPDRSAQSLRNGTSEQQQQLNQLEAQVRGLENELRLARGAWVRALSTGLSPYIHSAELDALRQQWVQVLAELSDAKETVFQLRIKQQDLETRRDRLIIASPVDGIVTDRQVESGDTVSVGESLLSITDTNSLYLEVRIPAEAEDTAQDSKQAKVFLNTILSQPLDVHVISIDRLLSTTTEAVDSSDNSSSSVIVQLSIENPNRAIVPGRTVEGEIIFLNELMVN